MRCGNFSTSGLPYYLEGPTWTLDDATGIATYTFQIGYRGPAKEPTPCYTTLEEATHKLMFHVCESGPAVRPSALPHVLIPHNSANSPQRARGGNRGRVPAPATLKQCVRATGVSGSGHMRCVDW